MFLRLRIAIFIRRESPTVSHHLQKRLRARRKRRVICSDSKWRKSWIHVTKQRYKPFTKHFNIIWDIFEFLSAPHTTLIQRKAAINSWQNPERKLHQPSRHSFHFSEQNNTVERPPLIDDHLSSATSFPKYQKFPSQITIFGTSCKRPL